MTGFNSLVISQHCRQRWSKPRLVEALELVCASTAFACDSQSGAVRLLGSNNAHLAVDPELEQICNAAGIRPPLNYFERRLPNADLCLEDGLSGMFIARKMRENPNDDWTILHLDDHADMMPALLVKQGDGSLVDPETGARFDMFCDESWRRAIQRGTVTIGSYFTPLFHGKRVQAKIHVRHLRPRSGALFDNRVVNVEPVRKTYPVFGNLMFAALEVSSDASGAHGTYQQTDCVEAALHNLPRSQVLVHIDLDYFVNDLNGNLGQTPILLSDRHRAKILRRMNRFFDAVQALEQPVRRWVIATSPGFCAARHWTWLLEQLSFRLSAITGQEERLSLV